MGWMSNPQGLVYHTDFKNSFAMTGTGAQNWRKRESPEYIRISLAAAMVLGFKNGLFYRNAKSPCINILLTYDHGCAGNCAYCGLSMKRPGQFTEKSFIRVEWNVYEFEQVMDRIVQKKFEIERICISMVTNKRAVADTVKLINLIHKRIDIPISVLSAPTVLKKEDFCKFKSEGAERIGIAVDTATPHLFERFRGKGVRGPHRWERYWQALKEAVEIFGRGNVGVHLIVGLGESEKEMVETIQNAHNNGIETHLFTFFPEPDSLLAAHQPPPIGQYRRIQLARYLINNNLATMNDLIFDQKGRITEFLLDKNELSRIIETGKPFMTSGCPNKNGEVACNRPYSDCLPGEDIRNFPFTPEKTDIEKIKRELFS